MTVWSPDFDLPNADWPKRTPDTMADLFDSPDELTEAIENLDTEGEGEGSGS